MKLLLLISIVFLSFICSCSKDDPESPAGEKLPDKGIYVTAKYKEGIYYWNNGKSTLLAAGEYHIYPKLSPDKQWILYAHNYNGEYRINVIKTNGDSLHSVFSGRTFKFPDQPEWSPDGKRIMIADTLRIFVTGFPNDITESYGIPDQRITGQAVTWNSTGSKIFFTSCYRKDYPWYSGIYSIDLNTKQIDTVIKTEIIDIHDLSCSADDANLAFTAYTPEVEHLDWNIHILNLKEKKLTLASIGEGQDLYPKWSPTDPDLLAFSGGPDKSAFPRLLVIFNNKTKSGKAITAGMHSPSDYPVWSKDGKKILFLRYTYDEAFYADVLSGSVTPIHIPCNSINW